MRPQCWIKLKLDNFSEDWIWSWKIRRIMDESIVDRAAPVVGSVGSNNIYENRVSPCKIWKKKKTRVVLQSFCPLTFIHPFIYLFNLFLFICYFIYLVIYHLNLFLYSQTTKPNGRWPFTYFVFWIGQWNNKV